MIDAHILFPGDAPKTAPAEAPQPSTSAQVAQVEAKTGKTDQPAGPDDAAAALFGSEVKSDPVTADHADALEPLDKLAESARLSGEWERGDQLSEASDVLMSEALEHGMPAADFRDLIGQVHEASATVSAMTAEQLADGKAKAMEELADIPASDLDLARGLIRDMSRKIPNLIGQLEVTGLGNNPKFVRAVVKEAVRRRAGR